ncbi:type IV pilus biogenesis protein PilM [Bacillus alveayuensis]|jgi:type IV pilus assembly protein PilM|uniref:type IV pilus biogenesis protein PilM n=1 Tax=Aeribacillus alveayuensis TaxID=279215 RepID=UPI0005D0F064|nr:pilus assembly protein PilM [Bacillus alveayuensis]
MKMFKGFQLRQKIANIIIKDHVIRYVELKQTTPLILSRCEERYLPSGIIQEGKIVDRETLETILEECVSDWKLKNRRVRFIVPDPVVVIRTISLPKGLEEDEIRSYLFMELGTTIHLPFEEPVFDYTILERTNEKLVILLFAAPEHIVKSYSELLEDVKLRPIAADISPLCIYRLFHTADQTKKEEHLLLVQVDLSAINVSAFHQHRPVFMRQLLFEGKFEQWEKKVDAFGNIVLEWKGKEDEPLRQLEDVYKEIERVMSFYRFSIQQGNGQISRILLTGDHPYLPQIYATMRERFDIVEMLSENLIVSDNSKTIPPSYHLALGLALKEGTS